MTITAPDLHSEQGGPDNGSSLSADPWTEDWALPSAQELKAVGWPGARPSLVVDFRDESAAEASPQVLRLLPDADVPGKESAETPEPEDAEAELADVVDLAEADQSYLPKRRRVRRHRRSRRGLRLTVAMVATAYWYFALATLVIALVVPLVAGWNSTTVMSNSMAPTLSQGDVVAYSEPDGSLLDVGTIIQFDDPIREGSTITHRIVGVNSDGTYQTKGDANRGPDSTRVPIESVTGVGRMVSPYAGLPHFWLATGQYVWLVAWILLTAAAAVAMTLGKPTRPRVDVIAPTQTVMTTRPARMAPSPQRSYSPDFGK